MKLSLIATVVLLALAQESFAQDFEGFTRYLDEIMKKMTETMSHEDLADQARKNLDPLSAQFHEQMKTVGSNVNEKVGPLTDQIQTHLHPLLDELQRKTEDILHKIAEQVKANQE